MGIIAKLLSFTRATRNGAPIGDVKCDPGGGAIVTAEHTAPAGDDSHPMPGDYVALSAAAGTGRQSAIGYFDPINAPKATPGEKRIYARNSAGEFVAEVWLRSSGACVINNVAGVFVLQPDGECYINGARITTGGDVITAAGVSLGNHTHNQGADSDGDGQVATNPPNTGG